MKKKVLFALIALFSFLSSWAASGASPVQVGKYTVVLTKNCIAVGEAAPSVLTVAGSDAGFAQAEGVYEYDAEKKEFSKVSGDLEVGDYFLKVTKGDDTFYAPFQVGMSYTDNLVRVNDAESFSGGWPDETLSIGGELAEGGAYYYYYQEYPWCDVWFRNGAAANGGWILYPGDVIENDMPNTAGRFARNADGSFVSATTDQLNEWAEGILSGPDETPYVAHTWSAAKESNPDNIVFSFPAEDEPSTDTWRVVLKYGNQESMPWGNRAFGESAKNYGLITANEIAQTFGLPSFEDGAEEDLSMVLLPQMAAYVLAPSVVYNGAETEGPGFALAGNVGNMPYDVVYVTEANDDAEEMERPTSVGTYYYKIKFYKAGASSNEYTGEVVYSNSFDVTGKQVIINPSRATKVYGEPDPDPEFAIDAASLAKGDEVETAIAPFLVFKRATGNDGEAVREYNYFIDFTDEYKAGECNYDIKILQNTALLVITKAPLHVTVTNDNKMWAQDDPSFADYTIVSGLVNGDENVTITITREAGEDINADLDADGKPVFRENETGYPFAAEAANYDIIFDNAFAITPSSNTDGITVTFDPASYVYNGAGQTPTPIVKDGTTLLEAGTDYDIDTEFGNNTPTNGYKDNKNVGEAICQIKLKGNYIATGDASKKQGTFNITKKALTVYAKSYTAEPANGYEVEYKGFVDGEDENNADGFTTPAAPIVSKGASIEQDVYALVIKKEGWAATNYEITPKDGIIALNNKPIIYARPDAKTQEYTGTVDKELTFATYTEREYTADYKMASNPVIAVVGQPVYVIAKEDPTNANVGAYDITLRGATVLKDYNVVYDDLTDGYTITYKNLILKGINTSKIYGDADPTFDALVYDGETPWTREQMNAAGIINNGPNNTGYYVGCGTWRNNRWNHGEDVKGGSNADGTYPITVGLRSRVYGNYYINGTEDGKFDILPFAAKVTAVDKTKQFGQTDPDFTVTITDNNNAEGHTIGTAVSDAFVSELADYWVAKRPDAGTEAGEAKGEHAIVVAAPKVDEQDVKPNNFTLTFVDGTLTITPAQIAVFARDQYVDYALDYNKKINPYDVIVVTPTETLVWKKSSQEGLSDEDVAINNKIKALVKLTVAKGKNKLGGNEDAFVLDILSDDYVLATEDVVLSDQYVYGGATIKNGFKNGWLTIYALETIPLGNAELAALVGVDPDEANANPSILQKVLNDHKAEGVKVNVKLPAREMVGDQWYAWVLPFAVKPSTLFSSDYFGYGAAEILDASKSAGNNVVFSLQVAKEIPANTPFIVKIEEDMEAADVNALVFEDVKIADMDYANNPATVASGVSFVGLYYDKKGPDATQKFLATTKNTAPQRDFWPGGDKSKNFVLYRTEAYLQFGSTEQQANARIFIEDENGTLTEINGVDADAEVAYGEGWYTITGVKLDAEPTTTGTYIFNGKKVFIQK